MQNEKKKINLQLEKERLRDRIRLLKKDNFEDKESDYFLLSLKMCEKVISFTLYDQSKDLGIYASKKSSYEIQTDAIIYHALSNKKIVYLPRCITENNNLEYVRIHNLKKDTQIATFSIREPKLGLKKSNQLLLQKNLTLLFIPGMAFDKFGNRIGYGTGYFDNFLNDLYKINKKIAVVGLAFDFQIFEEEIPHDSKDAKVDFIISPSKISGIPKINAK